MKIAITSLDHRTVTGHAGKTRRFLLFEGTPGGEPVETGRLDLPPELTFHQFEGGAHPIDGCEVLVTGGCGPGFFRKLAARGIRVVATSETDPLAAARAVLRGDALPEAPPHACACGHDHAHTH